MRVSTFFLFNDISAWIENFMGGKLIDGCVCVLMVEKENGIVL
jgi:hypothetical protein